MTQLRHLDTEMANAIWVLAELSTTSETPGVAADDAMDTLIMAARAVRDEQQKASREYMERHFDPVTGKRRPE